MVKYRIKFNPANRQCRLPKILSDSWKPPWIVWPDGNAAILYPDGADPLRVLQSIRRLEGELSADIEAETITRKRELNLEREKDSAQGPSGTHIGSEPRPRRSLVPKSRASK